MAVKILNFKVFLKSLTEYLFSMMLARIGFWSDGLHQFRSNESRTSLDPVADESDRIWLVVVGREHYFESARDYPIGHVGDLKKLLKNEPWRFPYKGVRLNRVERLTDQSHRVTSWIIKQEVLGGLPARPLWILPESVCLEALLDYSVIELDRLGKKILVASTADGLLSSLGHEESFNRRLGSELGGASDALGAHSRTKFEGSAAVESILLGVIRSLKGDLFQFFIGIDKVKIGSYPWVEGLKISAVIGLMYLGLTTSYLLLGAGLVDYRLKLNSPEAESALVIRDELYATRDKVRDFEAISEEIAPMWVAWDVMLDLEMIGVSFRAVNSNPPYVTYYLTATRATDVLAWFGQDSRILEAEFALPVRKGAAGDDFAIKAAFRSPVNEMGIDSDDG